MVTTEFDIQSVYLVIILCNQSSIMVIDMIKYNYQINHENMPNLYIICISTTIISTLS